jgi:hypothetical protein
MAKAKVSNATVVEPLLFRCTRAAYPRSCNKLRMVAPWCKHTTPPTLPEAYNRPHKIRGKWLTNMAEPEMFYKQVQARCPILDLLVPESHS